MKLFDRIDNETPESLLADEVDTVRRIVAQSVNHKRPVFGAPSHCPDCGEWGMVDTVDATRCANHCYRCGAQWIVSRRALAVVATEPTPLRPVMTDAQAASRARHPSNPRFVPTSLADSLTDLPAVTDDARAPRLRLAAVDGRRVQIVGA